jgi:phospholipase C
MNNISDNVVHNFCFALIIILFALIMVSCPMVENISGGTSGIPPYCEAVSKTPIKHVIVISQGKRSFDNYFGTFPGANGIPMNLTVPVNPFPQPVAKFSVAAWFNTNNSLSKNGFLVNKGGIGVDTPGKNLNYGIWMSPKGNIIAGFETKNGTDYTIGSNHTFNNGKWHNAIVTYNGNSLKLFIDGNLSGTMQTGGAVPDLTVTQPLRIGSNSLQPDNFFTGFIDEVRIWNRTLEYPEILKGYKDNAFDAKGQIIYLSFNNNSNKNEDNNSASPTATRLQLNGIYLNGSLYQDVNPNSIQYTKYVKPFHLEKTKTAPPYDGSKAYKMSYNKGKMNGFLFAQISNGHDPSLVMGHYNNKQLPYYWKLASQFVLADNFFAPTIETGLANHVYLYTAASAEYQKNISFRGFIDLNKTIFDELQSNGLSWKVYVQNYDPALNYTNDDLTKNRYINLLPAIPRFVDNKSLNSNIVDLVQYFRDLRSDNFPSVSYIVAPNYDESSPRDFSVGQEFVSSLILALIKSKHWSDSVFIITYRESGGWYDHVAPPLIGGELYGFRIPTLIISPFAKKSFVDSTFYDVTSILKFIEYNFGLQPLSVRDAKANNMLNAFDFAQELRKPVGLNYTGLQDAVQENGKIINKNGESIYMVKLIYLIVLSVVPAAGLVIWRSNRSKDNIDFIQSSGHK